MRESQRRWQLGHEHWFVFSRVQRKELQRLTKSSQALTSRKYTSIISLTSLYLSPDIPTLSTKLLYSSPQTTRNHYIFNPTASSNSIHRADATTGHGYLATAGVWPMIGGRRKR